MFDPQAYRPTERFTGLARAYARCRPGYPPEAVDYILGAAGPPWPPRVADVGCGTGISSRLLAVRGAVVVGVEPNAEMRAAAESAPFDGPGPPPAYRDGSAEATGLGDGSVDLVVAAQAFHWFDAAAALREFRRVLRPGGAVALLWNTPDEDDPASAAYWSALRDTSPEPELIRDAQHRAGERLLEDPCFVAAEIRSFPNRQDLTEEELFGRASSVSFAPREGPDADRLAERLRALFRAYAAGGRVTLRYRTVVYLARSPGRAEKSE